MFKIATYNANSIRVRLAQILAWLEREQPDVLCIQETKVQDHDFPIAPIREAGYYGIFRGQKSYAGVAILSRKVPQDVNAGFDEPPYDAPRLLKAQYDTIQVINTYVPQGRDVTSDHFQYKLAWFTRFKEMLERQYTPEQNVVWVGDFNVAPEPMDVYNPRRLREHVDFHPDVRAALEQVRQWGFVDVFRKLHPGEERQFTYWDYRSRNPIERGVGWRIDHVWATPTLAERVVSAWIDVEARQAPRPSDHTFLVVEFDI